MHQVFSAILRSHFGKIYIQLLENLVSVKLNMRSKVWDYCMLIRPFRSNVPSPILQTNLDLKKKIPRKHPLLKKIPRKRPLPKKSRFARQCQHQMFYLGACFNAPLTERVACSEWVFTYTRSYPRGFSVSRTVRDSQFHKDMLLHML